MTNKREDLLVVLPGIEMLSRKARNPAVSMKEWVETSCPWCEGEARRGTNMIDMFRDSRKCFMSEPGPNNNYCMIG